MNEHERENLEELLSSYIDGELSERQCNEVKRLVGHNEQAAAMLKEMQKYKALMGSLPQAQAPAHLFENVRASLERSVLLDEYHGKSSVKAGAAHLFARKLMATAAMIGLVAVLGFVIFSIVKPVSGPQVDVAKMFSAADKKPVTAAANMELVLGTEQATAVNAFVYRNIILDNGLQNSFKVEKFSEKNVYSITCSRARSAMILEELGTIWDKFNNTLLTVDGTEIAKITPQQSIQIAKEANKEEQIKLVKDFAAANKIIAEASKEAVASAGDKSSSEITITKPALTSGGAKPGSSEPADVERINLTIIITGKN